MSVRILIGDARERLGELADAGSCRALYERVSSPMAWLTERDQVLEPIGLAVVEEQSERANVVNVASSAAAMLACAAIPGFGLPLLSRPVRTAMVGGSPFELRMQLPDSVQVSAITGAVEAASGGDPALGRRQCGAAPDANTGRGSDLPRRHRSILAGARAMLAPPVSAPGWRSGECLSAMSARRNHSRPSAGEGHNV